MLNRRFVISASLAIALASLCGLQAFALYMPDPHRPSYEVPDLLKLPDRIQVDMTFRALDPDGEGEVYPLILPRFRDRSTVNAKPPETTPPDAFTRSLGLKNGNALYWQSPLPGAKRWIAVAYRGDRPVALYVDLDEDRKLSGNEKIVPADTRTHFAVPPFRRKVEGWTDHEMKFFLDAKRTWANDESPILSWSYTMEIGEHGRQMSMWFPHDATIGDASDDAFVRSLETGGKAVLYAQVRVKNQSQWTAVTTADSVAETLFFDIDADGKVSETEIVGPEYHEARFVTPAFMIAAQGSKRVPYRVFLYAKSREAPAWCPGGVWEGPIVLGDKTYRLIMFDTSMNGVFGDVGEDRYTFFSEKGPIRVLDEVIGFGSTLSVPTHALQRLVQIEGGNLFTIGAFEADAKNAMSGRVVLTRDTETWGSLSVSLAGDNGLAITSGELNVGKSDRADIHFALDAASRAPREIPAWTYAIRQARFSYKGETGDTWTTDCRGGTFEIKPDTPHHLELGKISLHVQAKGMASNGEPLEIKQGGELELTREVKGARGEVYRRFKNETSGKWIGSTLRILDPGGKEAAVNSMEYG